MTLKKMIVILYIIALPFISRCYVSFILHIYITALNALTGCAWGSRAHLIARDFRCEDVVVSTTNPVLEAGQNAKLTITYTGSKYCNRSRGKGHHHVHYCIAVE